MDKNYPSIWETEAGKCKVHDYSGLHVTNKTEARLLEHTQNNCFPTTTNQKPNNQTNKQTQEYSRPNGRIGGKGVFCIPGNLNLTPESTRWKKRTEVVF